MGLRRDQYQGSYLVNVTRKGKSRSKGLYLVAECCRQLDRYIETERLIEKLRHPPESGMVLACDLDLYGSSASWSPISM